MVTLQGKKMKKQLFTLPVEYLHIFLSEVRSFAPSIPARF